MRDSATKITTKITSIGDCGTNLLLVRGTPLRPRKYFAEGKIIIIEIFAFTKNLNLKKLHHKKDVIVL